jgi:predicted aconitase
MKLNDKQQELLDGKHGEARRIAMEKLVDFGKAVGAEEMVPLAFVLNACPITMDRSHPELPKYDMGHSPLYDRFIEIKDTRVVPEPETVCANDPYLVQIDKYEEAGYPWNFSWGDGSYKLSRDIYDGYVRGYQELKKHGWMMSMSCNSHLNARVPKFGEYCASSESSIAAYINTFIGARTNRESTVNTVYAAYAGFLPKYGALLDENRRARVIVELTDELKEKISDPADWAALGAVIAEKGANRLPAVLNMPEIISVTAGKCLSGCVSAGMNDPMLHLVGRSPESPTLEAAFGGRVPRDVDRHIVTVEDVRQAYRKLDSAPSDKVDIVVFGCPHATYEEIRQIARLIEGRKISPNVHLWVQTDTPSYHMAREHGEARIIEDAGGKIYHQTCMAMNPVRTWSHDLNIATNSYKYVKLGGGFGQGWHFGSTPDLVNAAVTGRFVSTRW